MDHDDKDFVLEKLRWALSEAGLESQDTERALRVFKGISDCHIGYLADLIHQVRLRTESKFKADLKFLDKLIAREAARGRAPARLN